MSIEDRINIIKEQIHSASQKRLNDTGEITLVAVTKTVGADAVKQALVSGIRDIAESRVQEAQIKFAELSDSTSSVKKHFIGHLQTNKVKKAVELFDLIQSVDSLRLADEINKQAEARGKIQDCLIEIKVSDEDKKFGILPENAAEFIKSLYALKNLRICGIMTMSPFFDNPDDARPYFGKAGTLFDGLKKTCGLPHFNILSMGMSNDFITAIEQGSNMVRIGSAIFGDR